MHQNLELQIDISSAVEHGQSISLLLFCTSLHIPRLKLSQIQIVLILEIVLNCRNVEMADNLAIKNQ